MGSQFAVKMQAVVRDIHPKLKAAGFRKERHTFKREPEPGLIHVVNFQMGPYEPGSNYEFPPYKVNVYGYFTVNLGVFLSEVRAQTMPGAPPRFPKEYQCEIRARLGELMPEGEGGWWTLKAETGLLASAIWEAIEEYGLPFLDRYPSRSAILAEWYRDGASALDRWEARGGLMAALIHAHRGEKALAEETLSAYYQAALVEHPRHASFVREVAERAGLALPPAAGQE
jgi:hypothetical protein